MISFSAFSSSTFVFASCRRKGRKRWGGGELSIVAIATHVASLNTVVIAIHVASLNTVVIAIHVASLKIVDLIQLMFDLTLFNLDENFCIKNTNKDCHIFLALGKVIFHNVHLLYLGSRGS